MLRKAGIIKILIVISTFFVIPIQNIYGNDDGVNSNNGSFKIFSENDELILQNLIIRFKKNGFYKIYVEDTDGNESNIQINVDGIETNDGHWSYEKELDKSLPNGEKEENNDEIIKDNNVEIIEENVNEPQGEIYESRSCEKYRIEFNKELLAYTSPDLKTTEYFINSDYLKRYIDSKNAKNIACDKNKSWISSPYIDNNTNTNYVVAPNGKVYFITHTNGGYSSSQIKSGITFSSIDELRAYVNKYNPFTEMSL